MTMKVSITLCRLAEERPKVVLHKMTNLEQLLTSFSSSPMVTLALDWTVMVQTGRFRLIESIVKATHLKYMHFRLRYLKFSQNEQNHSIFGRFYCYPMACPGTILASGISRQNMVVF